MQSCLCFSRLGKPLLRNSRRPCGFRFGGACSLPGVWPKNGRFSHIGQPKLPDYLQEEKVEGAGPQISQSTHKFQPFIAALSQTASKIRRCKTRRSKTRRSKIRKRLPIRMVIVPSKLERDQLRELQQSRVVHHPKPATKSIPPLNTTSHEDDAVPPSPSQILEGVEDISQTTASLTLASKQEGDGLPQWSLPSLESEKEIFETVERWERSPGVILAKILDMKDQSKRERFWLYIRPRISHRSLPIITIHYLLRSSVPKTEWTGRDRNFHEKAQALLDSRGMSWRDVSNWVWILSAPSPGEMVGRLVADPLDQPAFVLLEILRRDISKVKFLRGLLDYSRDRILKLIVPTRSPIPENRPGTAQDIEETTKPDISTSSEENHHHTVAKPQIFRIEETSFTVLISRLLYQTRRIWPSAMVDVANMAAHFLQSVSGSSVGSPGSLDSRTFVRFCEMNNYFLRLLALPSTLEPLQSMTYNWSAQKVLLTLAGQFEPPLRLDHASYRAVIQVLTASKKSAREAKSATFRNRSWPPWRVEQDGMDAQRSQDEDFSRVISAIMRSKESGYTQDSQLSVFGGLDTDRTPTIHTRKLLKWRTLGSFTQARESRDDEARLWAARIETTRDVHEAWGAFTEFRRKGGQANLAVYFAMLKKLNYESRRSGQESNIHATPGDGLEVFPVSDDNFTIFYRLRLQPPTLQDLYQEMRAAGIRPSGRCLGFLLRHARTTDEGLQYLLDSGLDTQVVAYLANGGERQVPANVVAQVSDRMLTDFISLVCRFAPRVVKTCSDSELEIIEDVRKKGFSLAHSHVRTVRKAGAQRLHHSRLRNPLQHTAFLLKSWQPKFRPAWYALFKSLARRDLVMVRRFALDPERMCENHEQAWRVTLAALKDFQDCDLELDPEGFRLICQSFAKYAEAAFHKSEAHRLLLIKTSHIIKAEYAKLTDGSEELSHGISRLWHTLEGPHLHAYVRAMGLIGNHAAIILLLEWMVKNHEELEAIALQTTNGHRMLRQTVVAIKAFCDGTDYAVATAQALVEQVKSWGGWPGEEEVRNYLDRGNGVRDTGTSEDEDEDEEDDWGEEDVEAQVAGGSGN